MLKMKSKKHVVFVLGKSPSLINLYIPAVAMVQLSMFMNPVSKPTSSLKILISKTHYKKDLLPIKNVMCVKKISKYIGIEFIQQSPVMKYLKMRRSHSFSSWWLLGCWLEQYTSLSKLEGNSICIQFINNNIYWNHYIIQKHTNNIKV